MAEDTLRNNPENVNNLHKDKFRLVFLELPSVQFFSSSMNLPGISQNAVEIPNAVNRLYVGSTKLTFEAFQLSFRVDEDLKNYNEVFHWLAGITSPSDPEKEFVPYNLAKNRLQNKNVYSVFSDATLISLTNSSNKNVNIFFREMMPISLTGLDFDNTDNGVLNATAAFNYTNYEIEVT